jgi:hypothetical protein
LDHAALAGASTVSLELYDILALFAGSYSTRALFSDYLALLGIKQGCSCQGIKKRDKEGFAKGFATT